MNYNCFSIVFSLQMAIAIMASNTVKGASSSVPTCHGQVCHAIEEYCSNFIEGCDKCSNVCDASSHNYNAGVCAKECSAYQKYDPLQAEIHSIRSQQNIILLLLVVLLGLIAIRYAYKCIRWLRHKRCLTQMLKKFQPKVQQHHAVAHMNGKNMNIDGATTITNVMAINDIERAPSQIYSVTGVEGSVMTVTTPVSTRYPAENSTTPTPTTVPTEYSYDNQALAVTPISEKPSNATKVF